MGKRGPRGPPLSRSPGCRFGPKRYPGAGRGALVSAPQRPCQPWLRVARSGRPGRHPGPSRLTVSSLRNPDYAGSVNYLWTMHANGKITKGLLEAPEERHDELLGAAMELTL